MHCFKLAERWAAGPLRRSRRPPSCSATSAICPARTTVQFIRCFLARFTTFQMSYRINDARRSRFCRDKQTVWRGEIGTVWGGGGTPGGRRGSLWVSAEWEDGWEAEGWFTGSRSGQNSGGGRECFTHAETFKRSQTMWLSQGSLMGAPHPSTPHPRSTRPWRNITGSQHHAYR